MTAPAVGGRGDDRGEDGIDQGKDRYQEPEAGKGVVIFMGNIGKDPDDHVLVTAEHEGNEDKENCLQTIFHNSDRSTGRKAVEISFLKDFKLTIV